jgi:hypothetical protein
MIKKEEEKKEAIRLRKIGKTYAQILSVIPVAKSTLSLWFREVGFSKRQKQLFTENKKRSAIRGGQTKKNDRINRVKRIVSHSKKDIVTLSDKELFLIGVALYWSEGAKEKEYKPGSGVDFINMDKRMVWVFLYWLQKVCKVSKDMIVFELYLHESHTKRVQEVQKYWSHATQFPLDAFRTVRFKKQTATKTRRKNTSESYYGALRIRVLQSSELVRKIAGWTEEIIENIK